MIDRNDPRLTAYALGELSREEADEFEQLIAGDREAQKEVEAIRQTGDLIRTGLGNETVPGLTADQRQAIHNAAAQDGGSTSHWRILRWGAVAAAACLALTAFLVLPNLGTDGPRIARYDASKDREGVSDSVYETAPGSEQHRLAEIETPAGTESEELEGMESRREVKAEAAEDSYNLARKKQMRSHPAPATAPAQPGHQPAPGGRGAVESGAAPAKPAQLGRALAAEEQPMSRTAGLRLAQAAQSTEPAGGEAAVTMDADGGRTADRFNREAYDRIYENPFREVSAEPLSTFSIDVDTASYSNIRRFLNQGRLPPPDAVRIEEMVNYFRYDYAPPTDEHPFAVHADVASCPWQPSHRLVRIGLKGRVPASDARPPANLVFLLDVSGSMRSGDKLPLLKSGMKMLTQQLTEDDRVAIVVYAGASGLVLPSTSAYEKEEILSALEQLQAGGSTNGGAGIELAYRVAQQNSVEGGINRVILATDGDFNVGVTDRGQLTRLIEEKARSGVFLTVLGFGTGNLQDATMEQLADKGNGAYAYIDSRKEARKVLVEQVGSTLHTIAKDVKIQVEFNPAQVQAHRLIGYENRILAHQDFNDDSKDAGEIGAGHTVTAFYEVIPNTGDSGETTRDTVGALKYQQARQLSDAATSDELLTVKLRYKQPDGDKSTLMSVPVKDSAQSWEKTSDDFQFSSSVALFGMILRNSEHSGNATLDTVIELAAPAAQDDPHGTRAEFLDLVRTAKELKQQ